jgi:uncharacterized OB-fold protein
MQSVPVTTGLFTVGDGGSLLAAHCVACAGWHFPASPDCPYCSAEGCETRAVSGDATLWLYTEVRNRPPGYAGEVPFGFGVVELAEGFRIVTRLTDADPAVLRPGMAMRFVVAPLHVDSEGRQVCTYAFAPAEAP